MLRDVTSEDHNLVMALLGGLFGLAVLMLGGNAHPPNLPVVFVGAPVFLAGVYSTIFFWAKGRFRR